MLRNSSDSGFSNAFSIPARMALNFSAGSLSCNRAKSRAAASPTRSGRVASACPSLIAAGPSEAKASA